MINLSQIGVESGPVEVRWTSDDTLLYALALGVGAEDPLDGLEFTTENSTRVGQVVLGTYAAVIAQNAELPRNLGSVDPTRVLHAGQHLRVHRDLPVDGVAVVRQVTSAIYDKGRDALAVIDTTGHDSLSGEQLFSSTNLSYLIGEGGFGGDRGPKSVWKAPLRDPDLRVSVSTSPNQALLYRLCGDRNPLHSDPVFAQRAGFDRPILHGLVSWGIAARVISDHFGIPGSLGSHEFSARFTTPVLPGARLIVEAWKEADDIRFRVHDDAGGLVVDEGVLAPIVASDLGQTLH